MLKRLAAWIDDRLGAAAFAEEALNKVFPDHWAFLLGEIAMYCFVVLLATGVFLTFFFDASTAKTVYSGHYAPLNGSQVSSAYSSVMHLSFDIRMGLVIRQIHHWAAVVFIAAIVAHLCRIFFTSAFRRPREINWVLGMTLMILSIFNGFTGYSLPDDLLSGVGLRIAYSIAISIPFIGPWMAFLVFGGKFGSPQIIGRLFIIHVLLIPAAIAGILGAHLAIVWRQKHTQFLIPGAAESNVVGERLWPTYATKSVGLFFGVAAVLSFLGGLVQINPVWLYGPYAAAQVSSPAQPDWYLGWLEGALRLFPAWQFQIFGLEIPNVFLPAIVLPGITFGLLYAWPFIEAWRTGDYAPHHVLDRPRDRPVHTALGMATLSFYAVLLFGGVNDLVAKWFQLPVESVTWTFRIMGIVLPILVGWLTYRLMVALRLDAWERARHAPSPEPVLAAAGAAAGPGSGAARWGLAGFFGAGALGAWRLLRRHRRE
ncbi:MAG: cytochrome b/b6 domain protein [Actinobacteria bacterium]|nr:cytochrome b/b6 domain protein [Actinomycetota bacterium]